MIVKNNESASWTAGDRLGTKRGTFRNASVFCNWNLTTETFLSRPILFLILRVAISLFIMIMIFCTFPKIIMMWIFSLKAISTLSHYGKCLLQLRCFSFSSHPGRMILCRSAKMIIIINAMDFFFQRKTHPLSWWHIPTWRNVSVFCNWNLTT